MIALIRFYSVVFFCCLFLIPGLVFSQEKSHQQTKRISESYSPTLPSKSIPQIQKNKAKFSTSDHLPSKNILEDIDTLNYPLEGEYSFYVFAGGYVSGNNEYGDKAKVNYFNNTQDLLLTGVLIDFAWATSSDAIIEVAAWDNSGIGNSPGNKIASTTVLLDDLFIDVLNENTSFISFENPVPISSSFYVGAMLPTGTDTLVVYTNTDGDTDPATAWEQWSDNSWYAYDDASSWEFKVSHAIFPIVNKEIGLTANFFASVTSLNPGQGTQFFNTSIGNPTSLEWSFPGGTPTSSAEEEPIVNYTTEGLYDVRLIVGDGNTFDTLIRTDYILVTDDIPVETDTLLFPLDGAYTIYILNQNQGYVCGTNTWQDLAKANYFANNESLKITGIVYDFLWASGGNPDIDLVLWNNNGPAGEPGNKLASVSVELNTIKSNITNQVLTYAAFDPPISINHPFYAGFELPTAANDTLVVWSNTHGDTNPGISWEWWQDGSWYPFSTAPSWELSIAMGIHPIVEYQTGIEDQESNSRLNIYPNPGSGIFTVEISDINSESFLQVFTPSGKLIQQQTISYNNTTSTVNLSELSSGVYYIRLVNEKGVIIEKVVKK